MRAFLLHGAEDLRLAEVPCPEPGPGEVLVRVQRAGICGSDLHYYSHGRCGNFVPTRPFILGHEFSGEVAALGEGVTGLEEGSRVAVDPSQPCGKCMLCRAGRYNLCPHMRYYGSASVDPRSMAALPSTLLLRPRTASLCRTASRWDGEPCWNPERGRPRGAAVGGAWPENRFSLPEGERSGR
jgi:threonine dehydrogenase-like Zn-dependent dehydrogenase